jgi:hypothetical protein
MLINIKKNSSLLLSNKLISLFLDSLIVAGADTRGCFKRYTYLLTALALSLITIRINLRLNIFSFNTFTF